MISRELINREWLETTALQNKGMDKILLDPSHGDRAAFYRPEAAHVGVASGWMGKAGACGRNDLCGVGYFNPGSISAMTGPILLAFVIWMLFTSDFSALNALIGLVGSIIVALLSPHQFSAGQLLGLVVGTLIRLPKAIWESFLIILIPHRYEKISLEKVQDPKQPWSVFCQTFLITFTPRSLVISEEREGKIQLHTLARKESE